MAGATVDEAVSVVRVVVVAVVVAIVSLARDSETHSNPISFPTRCSAMGRSRSLLTSPGTP